jgi:hypothetical protein
MTGKYRGLDLDEGWQQRRFAALEKELAELRAARKFGLRSEVVQVNIENFNLTNAFTDYGATNVTPPEGYNVALVQMLATAGVSFPGTAGTGGNVGVQPKAGGAAGIGQSQGGGGTGAGAGCSVTGSLAARLSVTPGVPFSIRAAAYANGSPTALTGNVRFSATIIYTRE